MSDKNLDRLAGVLDTAGQGFAATMFCVIALPMVPFVLIFWLIGSLLPKSSPWQSQHGDYY